MKTHSTESQTIREPKRISIVAPAFNEERILQQFYERVKNVLESTGYPFELVIVENGSTDESLEILKRIRKSDPRLHYISLTRNFGHQGALIAGLENACGDVVILMDADLQHPPELIPEMLDHWKRHYDVVYTVKRDAKAQPFLRRVLDRWFYGLMQKLSGIELYGQSDYRLMDRKAVEALCALPERNKFLRGLTRWVGFHQIGVSYDVAPRPAGESKFRLSHLIKFAVDGIFSFSIIPLRLFVFIGIFISLGSFVYGIYLVILQFYAVLTGSGENIFPSGWTTLIFVMLFLGGVQLIGIGLLGEYLGRVYDEVKGRPAYIIQQSSRVMDKQERKLI